MRLLIFLLFFLICIGYTTIVFAENLSSTHVARQQICYDAKGNTLDSCNPENQYAVFRDNGNGTVTDLNNNLMWQQDDDRVKRVWREAIEYCNNLNLAGYADWRLPIFSELKSIVDNGQSKPSINPVFQCRSSFYLSTTPYLSNPVLARAIHFHSGDDYYYCKDYRGLVRCVRGN